MQSNTKQNDLLIATSVSLPVIESAGILPPLAIQNTLNTVQDNVIADLKDNALTLTTKFNSLETTLDHTTEILEAATKAANYNRVKLGEPKTTNIMIKTEDTDLAAAQLSVMTKMMTKVADSHLKSVKQQLTDDDAIVLNITVANHKNGNTVTPELATQTIVKILQSKTMCEKTAKRLDNGTNVLVGTLAQRQPRLVMA